MMQMHLVQQAPMVMHMNQYYPAVRPAHVIPREVEMHTIAQYAAHWASRQQLDPQNIKDLQGVVGLMTNESGRYFISPSEISMGTEIDRGSFGVISQAKHNGVSVAMKRFNEDKAGASGMGQIIRNAFLEILVLQNLNHPHIVVFKGVCADFQSNGNKFELDLVFELCHNGNLYTHMFQKKIPIGFTDRLRIASEVAEGMTYLHNQKILHRDLSSRNVLLTSDMKAKISDFGLARKFSGDSYSSTTISGSPPYMSPEQLAGQALTLKADVWSMGVLIWELVCVEVPWKEEGRNLSDPDLFYQMIVKDGKRLPILSSQRFPSAHQHKIVSDLLVTTFEINAALRPTMSQVGLALRAPNPQQKQNSPVSIRRYSEPEFRSGHNVSPDSMTPAQNGHNWSPGGMITGHNGHIVSSNGKTAAQNGHTIFSSSMTAVENSRTNGTYNEHTRIRSSQSFSEYTASSTTTLNARAAPSVIEHLEVKASNQFTSAPLQEISDYDNSNGQKRYWRNGNKSEVRNGAYRTNPPRVEEHGNENDDTMFYCDIPESNDYRGGSGEPPPIRPITPSKTSPTHKIPDGMWAAELQRSEPTFSDGMWQRAEASASRSFHASRADPSRNGPDETDQLHNMSKNMHGLYEDFSHRGNEHYFSQSPRDQGRPQPQPLLHGHSYGLRSFTDNDQRSSNELPRNANGKASGESSQNPDRRYGVHVRTGAARERAENAEKSYGTNHTSLGSPNRSAPAMPPLGEPLFELGKSPYKGSSQPAVREAANQPPMDWMMETKNLIANFNGACHQIADKAKSAAVQALGNISKAGDCGSVTVTSMKSPRNTLTFG